MQQSCIWILPISFDQQSCNHETEHHLQCTRASAVRLILPRRVVWNAQSQWRRHAGPLGMGYSWPSLEWTNRFDTYGSRRVSCLGNVVGLRSRPPWHATHYHPKRPAVKKGRRQCCIILWTTTRSKSTRLLPAIRIWFVILGTKLLYTKWQHKFARAKTELSSFLRRLNPLSFIHAPLLLLFYVEITTTLTCFWQSSILLRYYVTSTF